jgi:hypothetical protein
MTYKRQELLTLCHDMGSPPFLVEFVFIFLCYVFCIVCLRSVSFVPNVASFS